MTQQLDIKHLLEAGAHFGHQTHKWNPRMKPYIFGKKNGIYILDLSQTVDLAKDAYEFLRKTAASGKSVLFVGTKRQAQQTVKEAAIDCGAFYVTHRWLGGMLTNFKTIALSIDKLRKVDKMKESGDYDLLTKKEQSKIEKEVTKLEDNLGGIKNMRKLPGAIFVVDPEFERTAIKEANNLNIPVVALIDSNCNPAGVDYLVPANDDAVKSIKTFTEYFSNAVKEGGAKANVDQGSKPGVAVVADVEKEILKKFEQDIDLKEASAEEGEE